MLNIGNASKPLQPFLKMANKKNILIISYAFEPNPSIGARRISKITKELEGIGWNVIVISSIHNLKHQVETDINNDQVHYVKYFSFFSLLSKVKLGFIGEIIDRVIMKLIGDSLYKKSWITNCMLLAEKVFLNNNIDLMYSTFAPKENIVLANKLKILFDIPWVNEYRDLWYGNPYFEVTNKTIQEFNFEKKLIKAADRLVTVSEPLREELIKYHNKPTDVIYNGFDFLDEHKVKYGINDKLIISYTGTIYLGKRDPNILFLALKSLKQTNPDLYTKVKVYFYGPQLKSILSKAIKDIGITEAVSLNDTISHREVIEIQRKSDILLLLGWNNPKERGVATGKLFEYIGRQKKIMAITYPRGVVADILEETNLGRVYENVEDIKNCLIKHIKKQISFNPNERGILKYSRKNQVIRLSNIIEDLIEEYE